MKQQGGNNAGCKVDRAEAVMITGLGQRWKL